MANDQLIPLNIVIADRSYSIKILASDEETIRRVLKTINEKIVEFKTQFGRKRYAGLCFNGFNLVCNAG